MPFLGARNADVARGAYVIADAQGTPDLILIATGSEVSLALDAKKILDGKGVATRVVSMPCWELFEEQPDAYRDDVLPPAVTARMSIEAGATFGWKQWVGDRGLAFGNDHFGTLGARGGDRQSIRLYRGQHREGRARALRTGYPLTDSDD